MYSTVLYNVLCSIGRRLLRDIYMYCYTVPCNIASTITVSYSIGCQLVRPFVCTTTVSCYYRTSPSAALYMYYYCVVYYRMSPSVAFLYVLVLCRVV